jgi:predicted enzyme related to lactoylglutathione lyase
MNDPMATHGAPSWIEHQGEHPERARQFYADVLDWTVSDLPMKDGSSYPGIMVGEQPVGGILPMPVADAGWRLYVTVDDADARYHKALEAGAVSVSEPASMPGVGRMATIKDPFGASIAFITYESDTQGS